MKSATLSILKKELKTRSEQDLVEICLRLSKHKTENKELLTYLLFESNDEDSYIKDVKEQINHLFELVNIKSYYTIRKGVRKILLITKKQIRYSGNKQTSVELLLHFCIQLKTLYPNMKNLGALLKMYETTINTIEKQIGALHEDFQYDYNKELEKLIV